MFYDIIFNFNDSKRLSKESFSLCLLLIESTYSPSISSPGFSFQLSEFYNALLPHSSVLPYASTVRKLPLLQPLSLNNFSFETSPYLDPFAFCIWPRLRTSHLLASQPYFLLLISSSVQTKALRGSCNRMQ